MKWTSFLIGLLLLLVLAFPSHSWGVTCLNKWCGPYSVPMYDCLSGSSNYQNSGCHNHSGSRNIGFYSTSPSGTSSTKFGGITASQINGNSGTAGPDVVPNGSVGLDDYMQYANNWVQAYSKTNDGAIFSNASNNGSPQPQKANSPWEPYLGSGSCGPETADYNVVYDHLNGVFVLSGASAVPSGQTNAGDRFLCIATSAGEDLYNSGTSYWSAYAFDLTSNISDWPSDSSIYDLADYPRFGTWKDGYYMSFDFVDNNSSSQYFGRIDGFVVCQLDETDIAAGKAANNATCYTYIPTSAPPMIHTLLPADMESTTSASGTKGEFFMATVNPGTDGNPCKTSQAACSSDQLAFWTWSDITAEHLYQAVSVNTFYPGCYNITTPGSTVCPPQPGTTNEVDSVGDRLMSPLAYRYLSPCDQYPLLADSCEYLAVTQTVNEGTNGIPPTGIRYYGLVAPLGTQTTPRVLYQGDFKDSGGNLYYWMPSNAIDKDENVAYTFTVGDGSGSNYPSIYADSIDDDGATGTLSLVQSGSGSITDTSNHYWGPYVSTSIDPSDDLTFWSTGQFIPTGGESNCDQTTKTGCNWQTEIFNCTKGAGYCN
jgi:hypothetical protein